VKEFAMPPAESRFTAAARFLRPSAAVIGLIYVALGVIGFLTPETATSGHDTSRAVWIFSTSSVLNLVHVVVGVLGLLAATRQPGALIYSMVLFVGFTGLTAYGVLATAFGNPEDPVNVNWADDVLHGLTAVAGLALAITGMRAATARRTADDRGARPGPPDSTH
jgi:hypothetical protein